MMTNRGTSSTILWQTVTAVLLLALLCSVSVRGQDDEQRFEGLEEFPDLPPAGEDFELVEDQEWESVTEFDPESPEGQLQTAHRYLEDDRPGKAEKLAGRWITDFPNHPQLVEAYVLRGDARRARRNFYQALYDYEEVLRGYPASEWYAVALEREFEIAERFAGGTKRKLWGMRILSAAGEAEEIFIRIQERSPGSELGEKASLALADFYFRRAAMVSAAEAYDLFLINYPRSEHREHAMLRLIQASLATFKGPRFDSTGLLEAAERIRQYELEYPAGAQRLGTQALLVRIEESLALKELYTAEWYDRRSKRVSAVYLYRRLVRDHPQTGAARQAVDRMALLGAPVVPVAGPAPRRHSASPFGPARDLSQPEFRP